VGQPLRMHLPNVLIHAHRKHQLRVRMARNVSHSLHVLALNLAPTFVDAILMMHRAVALFRALMDLLDSAQIKKVVMHTRPAPRPIYQLRNPLKMRLSPIILRFQLNLIIAD